MPQKIKTPWLGKRAGRYYVFWSTPKRTERLSLRTADEDEARIRYAAFLVDGKAIYDGQNSSEEINEALTVELALEQFYQEVTLQQHSNSSAATVKTNKQLLIEILGQLPLVKLRKHHINHFIEVRSQEQKCSMSTIRKNLSTLQAAVNYAVREKRISSIDAPRIYLPPAAQPRDRWLTKNELKGLTTASFDVGRSNGRLSRCYRFVKTCYYTAGRREAVETLKWAQVDLDKNLIYLNPPDRQQNRKRRAVVPISKKLRPILLRAHRERSSEYVMDVPGAIYRPFMQACEIAGLEGVSPHTLRHSRATHLLQDGKDIWAVAKLLGDKVQTVDKVYGHHCPVHLATILDSD